VYYVEKEEAVEGVLVLGGYTDRETSCGCVRYAGTSDRSVNAEDGGGGASVSEIQALGLLRGDVVHKS
jgi:hypothetical protein